MFMIMGWDDLVPSVNGLVSSLFCELLRYGGFSGTCRVDFHDAEIQLLSVFEEGLVSDYGPHSGNLYGVHWFPRCHSFGADDNGGRKCAHHPIGVSVRRREPWITKNKVIQSHVGDIEMEKVGSFSDDDFKFSEIFQTPSCVRGSVSILEFSGILHEMHP